MKPISIEANLTNALASSYEFWVDRDSELNEKFNAWLAANPGAPVMALEDAVSRGLLLAPCDLQAVKACGVTFARSMIERVIEEQAGGDASKAEAVRATVRTVIGDNLRAVRPGSQQAMALKALLLEKGMWSQYLEVGIGPDAEIFTKAQPMSSVTCGDAVGIHPISQWNNPEPES